MWSRNHRRICGLSVFSLLLCFSSPGWCGGPGGLYVGWAKVDLTPSFACPLAGYGKRRGAQARGVHDALYARALILEGGGEKIVLASVDLVLIPRPLREEVAKRVSPLGVTALLLSATHTHSGVGGYWDNVLAETTAMGGYDEKIFRFLVDRIVRAVREADTRRSPAKVGVGVMPVDGLNRNRQKRGGPVDPELAVIRIDDTAGRPLAVVVNFSAHATTLGPQNLLLSADFPGALTAALERRLPIALFTAGAAGNVSPRSPGAGNRYERATALGTALAQKATEVMAGIGTSGRVSLRSRTREVRLPRATVRTFLPFPFFLLADPVFRLFTPRTTLLQAVRINQVVLSAWPCEVGVELGLALKHRARLQYGQHLFVVSQANDYIGYVLTEEGYRRGGYEARMSFFGPQVGAYLGGQMGELLQEVQ